uniref:Uncharacterized protein n=1 Tax=Arundo donax TaxID=35708 RepID=A0A0A9ASG5_ARUDO
MLKTLQRKRTSLPALKPPSLPVLERDCESPPTSLPAPQNRL